ncbi:unnamed protein product, partial [Pylaiella littoralis]
MECRLPCGIPQRSTHPTTHALGVKRTRSSFLVEVPRSLHPTPPLADPALRNLLLRRTTQRPPKIFTTDHPLFCASCPPLRVTCFLAMLPGTTAVRAGAGTTAVRGTKQ